MVLPAQTSAVQTVDAIETSAETPTATLVSVSVPFGAGRSITGQVTGVALDSGDIYVATIAALAVHSGEQVEQKGASVAVLHDAGTGADNWSISFRVDTASDALIVEVNGDSQTVDWCLSYQITHHTDAFAALPDHLPDPFVFVDMDGAQKSSRVSSNEVVITGIDGAVPFSISGGTAIIDGVNAGSSGTLNHGQSIRLEATASTLSGADVIVSWVIGTAAGDWRVSTAPYTMTLVEFDGVNDSLHTNSGFTAAGASTKALVSFHFRIPGDSWTPVNEVIARIAKASGDFAYEVRWSSLGNLTFRMYNNAATIAEILCSANSFSPDTLHHVLIGVDTVSGMSIILVDGVEAGYAINTIIPDAASDPLGSGLRSYIGAGSDANSSLTKQVFLGDLYMNTQETLDLSIPANIAKFYDAGPVDLGLDGSAPTGNAPAIFLSGPVESWHQNKGTGGGYDVNGALSHGGLVGGTANDPIELLASDYHVSSIAELEAVFQETLSSDPSTVTVIDIESGTYNGDVSIQLAPTNGDILRDGAIYDPDRETIDFDSTGFPTALIGRSDAVAGIKGGHIILRGDPENKPRFNGKFEMRGVGPIILYGLDIGNETATPGYAYEPEASVKITSIISLGATTTVSVAETKSIIPGSLVNITGAVGFPELAGSFIEILSSNGDQVTLGLDTTGLTHAYVADSAAILGEINSVNAGADGLLITISSSFAPAPAHAIIRQCRFGAPDATDPARVDYYGNGLTIRSAQNAVVEDCEFDGFYNGLSILGTESATVRRNSFRRIISDGIRAFNNVDISHVSGDVNLTLSENVIFDPILSLTHAARHNDGIQIGSSSDAVGYDVLVKGNVMHLPGAQCIYIDDYPDPYRLSGVIAQNLCAGELRNGIRIWRNENDNVQVINNTLVRTTDPSQSDDPGAEPIINNANDGRVIISGNVSAGVISGQGDDVFDAVDIDHLSEIGQSSYATVFTGPFTFDPVHGAQYGLDYSSEASLRSSLSALFEPKDALNTGRGFSAPATLLPRPPAAASEPLPAVFQLADMTGSAAIMSTAPAYYLPDSEREMTFVMRVARINPLAGQEFMDAGSSTRMHGTETGGTLRISFGGERFSSTTVPTPGALTTIILSANLARQGEDDRYRLYFDYLDGERRLRDLTKRTEIVDVQSFTNQLWSSLSLLSGIDGGNRFTCHLDYIGFYNRYYDLDDVSARAQFLPENIPADGVLADGTVPTVFVTGGDAIGPAGGSVNNAGSVGPFTRSADIVAVS